VRTLSEGDLLDYTKSKLEDGYAPATILNGLSIVRRVLGLAVRDGVIPRNPALGVGSLIARVARTTAAEVRVVDSWTRGEIETLLRVAAESEHRVAPILHFLVSTGARRGEALGLRWEDVDFDRSRISIRRALTKGVLVTPKSGKARVVAMPPSLAEALFDLLGERRQECLRRGWPELPAWVFASEAGTPLDEGNLTRAWHRVRRRAQKEGVRPFKLHAARHTFASLALAAGRSIRWVADQLGHANPELTLRTYSHSLPVEEADLPGACSERDCLTTGTPRRGAKRAKYWSGRLDSNQRPPEPMLAAFVLGRAGACCAVRFQGLRRPPCPSGVAPSAELAHQVAHQSRVSKRPTGAEKPSEPFPTSRRPGRIRTGDDRTDPQPIIRSRTSCPPSVNYASSIVRLNAREQPIDMSDEFGVEDAACEAAPPPLAGMGSLEKCVRDDSLERLPCVRVDQAAAVLKKLVLACGERSQQPQVVRNALCLCQRLSIPDFFVKRRKVSAPAQLVLMGLRNRLQRASLDRSCVGTDLDREVGESRDRRERAERESPVIAA
jgi:integrase